MTTMSSTVGYDIMQTEQESVDGFIERLAAFSLDQWMSVAATHDARLCAGATATLEQLVAYHALGVDAWSSADDVETAFHYSIGAGRFSADTSRLRVAVPTIRGARPAVSRSPAALESRASATWSGVAVDAAVAARCRMTLPQMGRVTTTPIRMTCQERTKGTNVATLERRHIRVSLGRGL